MSSSTCLAQRCRVYSYAYHVKTSCCYVLFSPRFHHFSLVYCITVSKKVYRIKNWILKWLTATLFRVLSDQLVHLKSFFSRSSRVFFFGILNSSHPRISLAEITIDNKSKSRETRGSLIQYSYSTRISCHHEWNKCTNLTVNVRKVNIFIFVLTVSLYFRTQFSHFLSAGRIITRVFRGLPILQHIKRRMSCEFGYYTYYVYQRHLEDSHLVADMSSAASGACYCLVYPRCCGRVLTQQRQGADDLIMLQTQSGIQFLVSGSQLLATPLGQCSD